jgi:hypothetical protein
MPDPGIEAYSRELAARVNDAAEAGAEGVYNEQEFTRIVLDELGEEGAVDDPAVLWYEGNLSGRTCKITGCSMPEDNERLTLITTIYRGEVPPVELTTDEKLSAYFQAIKFFEDSRNGLYEKIDPSMGEVRDFSRRIHEARDTIDVLRVILISDQVAGFGHADLKGAFEDTRIVVDPYGIDRLYRLLGKGLTRDDIVIDIERELHHPLPCLKVSNGGETYDVYLAAIPGSLLADVYEKYGTRLLELNVRAFLGLGGKKSVNAGLRTTILQTPNRFLAYNNGLVTTVDSLDLTETEHGGLAIRKLRGLQIVNGGQTTASLHRAMLQDTADLREILVPIKIIRVSGSQLSEMVSAVSRSANSQNTVQPADFSANEPFHVAVENLANNVWIPGGGGRWFYERARGSYRAAKMALGTDSAASRRFLLETPKDRVFAKTDLAKYLNAWNGLPYLVSYGSQKNFQYFMQALKDEHAAGFIPDEKWFRTFIAKLIIFRTTQDIIKLQKFAAYQAIISAYTVACLAQRYEQSFDLEHVWSHQSISPQLASLIQQWAIAIDKALRRTAGARMPSEWAKKLECWDAIREIALEAPATIPPELHAPAAAHDLEVGEPLEATETIEVENDIGSLLLRIRPLFARDDMLRREDFAAKLSEMIGYPASDPKGRQETDSVIQAAVRRGILQDEGHEVSLVARNISEYPREVLKDQFLASLNGSNWTERSESIPRFARWLGFRRTGPNIEDAARSVINSLIRGDRLEKMGSQIRRA